jgi:hypothetical protein
MQLYICDYYTTHQCDKLACLELPPHAGMLRKGRSVQRVLERGPGVLPQVVLGWIDAVLHALPVAQVWTEIHPDGAIVVAQVPHLPVDDAALAMER